MLNAHKMKVSSLHRSYGGTLVVTDWRYSLQLRWGYWLLMLDYKRKEDQ